MDIKDLIALDPQVKTLIENDSGLMQRLKEEIKCAGSLDAAVYNSLSIVKTKHSIKVFNTDGFLLKEFQIGRQPK